MYKTKFIERGSEWSVVLEQKGKIKPKLICIVPNYYLEDEALAEAIATLLNENRKIKINLDF